MTFRVRGIVLPEREEKTLWIDGDRLRTEPAGDAETVVDGGWLIPGLVDVHTHPGTTEPGAEFDEQLLVSQLTEHRDRGVLLVRTPGSAARIPAWAGEREDLPRIRSAGPWLAMPGRFFPGWGRRITEAQLVQAAVEEATASSGWCKVIGDWGPGDPPVPLDNLKAAVQAVHAIGGKVAVHCMTAEGCHNAVTAGADSLEHGMHLDPALLDTMARQGTALVPTLSVFHVNIRRLLDGEPSPYRDWILSGFATMTPLIRDAHEAGVTILAGTDTFVHGKVTGEVALLREAGLPADTALGAASWTARAWLGLPGLTDGAPADLVAYDVDPAREPTATPSRIILRGRIVR